jgi:lipopolysaccharide/colanic/teichoic acid biosynthesis glycosyltransferase
MTGWWQVNGRGDRSMHSNTEIDLFYVQNYSILLDIQILLRTLGAVIRGKGAF